VPCYRISTYTASSSRRVWERALIHVRLGNNTHGETGMATRHASTHLAGAMDGAKNRGVLSLRILDQMN
jgi:hypothetical protein